MDYFTGIHIYLIPVLGEAMIISASALSCDILKLGDEIIRTEKAGANALHFDIMDGAYVDNFTFGLQTIESVRGITKLPIEVHLEILQAERHTVNFINAGADTIIVHSDAVYNPIRVLSTIRRHGAKAGFAINPADPIDKAFEILEYIDMLLVMSVEPGFGGQPFHIKSKEKLRHIVDSSKRKYIIAMDGGINKENIKEIARLGVDEVIVGSALYANDAIEHNINQFRELLEECEGGNRFPQQKKHTTVSA